MQTTVRRTLAGLALALALAGVSRPMAAAEKRDGVFIHISHGPKHAHRVLMALNMAAMWAEDHPVLVYFDVDGIEVVLKDAPDITYAHFPSSRTQLSNLVKKGVQVLACPGCLRAAGKSPADLAPGIRAASKKQFFSFTEGRILSLDY